MFRKYNTIENSYQKSYLEKVLLHGFGVETYIVQEKAHGANLSFWSTDGVQFLIAKRSGWIQEEAFYNAQDVARQLQGKLEELWERLQVTYPKLEEVAIFGELIGGYYGHPDVQRSKKAIRIQKGIDYSPHNDFYAFDIKVNREYIPIDESVALFSEAGFLHARTLFQGTLEEALAYPNKFESTIPEMLGLPAINDNFCEGVVIKPLKTLRLPNGSRVIFKNKKEVWSEKEKVRKVKAPPLPKEVQEGIALLHSYITVNRYHNVVSKIGQVTRKDFKSIIKAFSLDILEDFTKENEERWNALKKEEQKILRKSIGKKASRIINENIPLDE